jgi:hypothetical protein
MVDLNPTGIQAGIKYQPLQSDKNGTRLVFPDNISAASATGISFHMKMQKIARMLT